MTIRTVILISSLLMYSTLHAQQTNPPSADDSKAEETQAAASAGEPPFQFTFGPNEEGNVGAVLAGAQAWSPDRWRRDFSNFNFLAPYVELAVDAKWNSAEDALNQSSVRLRPSLLYGGLEIPCFTGSSGFEVFADARQQYGTFEVASDEEPAEGEEAEPKRIDNVNQTMYGAGFEMPFPCSYRLVNAMSRWSGVLDMQPRISATYYRVNGTSVNEIALPKGITEDQLLLTLRAGLHLRSLSAGEKKWPLRFDIAVDASKAMGGDDREWKDLTELALVIDRDGEVKPVLKYVDGERLGFEYDQQLILGIIWELVRAR